MILVWCLATSHLFRTSPYAGAPIAFVALVDDFGFPSLSSCPVPNPLPSPGPCADVDPSPGPCVLVVAVGLRGRGGGFAWRRSAEDGKNELCTSMRIWVSIRT